MDYQAMLEKCPSQLKKEIRIQVPGTHPDGKILFGCGVAGNIGREAELFGAKKVFFVTDKVIVSLGIDKLLIESLKNSGISVDVFDEVAPEPHMEVMVEIQNKVRQANYDLIVGLGGGSALDAAKLAAAAAKNSCSVEEMMADASKVRDALPSILVPTTSGTGSECSPYVVTSNDVRKLFITSYRLYAKVALVDPLLTATMPPKVTAATGLDALTHGVEGACANPHPFSLAMSAKCAELVFQYLPKAVKNGEDVEARYYMAFASVLGMLAYIQGGGLYAHSTSYVLTTTKNMPHGAGCGLALPYTLRFNQDVIGPALKELGPVIDRSDLFSTKSEEETIACFHQLVKTVGLAATLKEADVAEADLDDFADTLIRDYYRANNPKSMDNSQARAFVRAMYDGNLAF